MFYKHLYNLGHQIYDMLVSAVLSYTKCFDVSMLLSSQIPNCETQYSIMCI